MIPDDLWKSVDISPAASEALAGVGRSLDWLMGRLRRRYADDPRAERRLTGPKGYHTITCTYKPARLVVKLFKWPDAQGVNIRTDREMIEGEQEFWSELRRDPNEAAFYGFSTAEAAYEFEQNEAWLEEEDRQSGENA